MKKAILNTFFGLGGFRAFHLAHRQNATILTYHRFSKGNHPLKVSKCEFIAHLEYLKKHSNVVPLCDLVQAAENGDKLPPSSVAITIDDGYRDVFEIAYPILREFDFPATLFAITDFIEGEIWLWTDKMRYVLLETKKEKVSIDIEKYATIESKLEGELSRLTLADQINSILKKLPNTQKESQIAAIAETLGVAIPETPTAEFGALNWEMAREMDQNSLAIESHTVTHPILTNIEEDQLMFELNISKERLENKLGKMIDVFCYPNGAFNEKVAKAVENSGYKFAVTTNFGFANRSKNKYSINRIDGQRDILDFAQNVSGFESIKQKLRGA